VFALMTGAGVFPPTSVVLGSIFATERTRGVFERFYVAPSVELHAGPWRDALLGHLHSLVADGGEVLVPADETGWHPAPAVDGRPPSVLAWLLETAPAQVHASMLALNYRLGTAVEAFDDMLLEMLFDTPEVVVTAPRRRAAEAGITGGESWFERPPPDTQQEIDYPAAFARSLHALAVQGVEAGRRAALVRRLTGDGPASVLDLGGGFGLTAAELVLDPESPVECALACERASWAPSMAAGLYRAHRGRLAGRWYFSPQAPATFTADRDFTHVLVSRGLRRVADEEGSTLLERAWDLVRPGGALVSEAWTGAAGRKRLASLGTVEDVGSALVVGKPR
jgi:hypothetical protein